MFRRVQAGVEAEAEGSEDGEGDNTPQCSTDSRLQALIQNSKIKPFKDNCSYPVMIQTK